MKITLDFEEEEISLICFALNLASVSTRGDRTAEKMNILWDKLKPFSGDKCWPAQPRQSFGWDKTEGGEGKGVDRRRD